MSVTNSNGCALLCCAIRIAIQAKAPRRTVQGIAASVTSVILGSGPRMDYSMVLAGDQLSPNGCRVPAIIAALTTSRAARAAKRKRAKLNKKAAKEAAKRTTVEKAADLRSGIGNPSAVESAQAS